MGEFGGEIYADCFTSRGIYVGDNHPEVFGLLGTLWQQEGITAGDRQYSFSDLSE